MASCQRIPRQCLPLWLGEEPLWKEARSDNRGGIQDACGDTDTLVAVKNRRNMNMYLGKSLPGMDWYPGVSVDRISHSGTSFGSCIISSTLPLCRPWRFPLTGTSGICSANVWLPPMNPSNSMAVEASRGQIDSKLSFTGMMTKKNGGSLNSC